MKQTVIVTISSLILALTLVGCTNSQKQTAGIAGGAVVGGLAGHALTGGSAAGTVVGAALGGVVGNRSREVKKVNCIIVALRGGASMPSRRATINKILPFLPPQAHIIMFFVPGIIFMALQVGDKAPEFTLTTDTNEILSLKALRGKRIILYFYPKDHTPGCTKEACDFRDHFLAFAEQETVILGISKDSPATHQQFKTKACAALYLIIRPRCQGL